MVATVAEQKKGRGGRRPGAGRPKGARSPARPELGSRIVVSCSAELKAFVGELAGILGGTESDAVREGLRMLASELGKGRPPLR
jgi:hypothetical protein